MLSSELNITVIDAFQKLVQALDQFETTLDHDNDLPAWVQPTDYFHFTAQCHYRHQAMRLIKQLEYLEDQAPREILIMAGFIAASPQTIEAAHQLNEAKCAFKESIITLKQQKIKLPKITQAALNEAIHDYHRHRKIASNLNRIGLARLHLKQCYRLIPILPDHPKKISWTWAHTRSIKKITRQQAEQMLIKKGQDQGIQYQLEKLYQLPANEPLAIIQELAPHLRANIVFHKDTSHSSLRMMIKGPVPILYPENAAYPIPEYSPPTLKKAKSGDRLTRNDVKIDPHPYIPAIRAHRYTSP